MNPNASNKKKELIILCSGCDYKCFTKQEYDKHILAPNYKILINPTKNEQKNEQNHNMIYLCECCNYKCFKKGNYARHVLTLKHRLLTAPNENEQNEQNIQCEIINQSNQSNRPSQNKLYICNCGKKYKHSSSLCAHKNKCNNINIHTDITNCSINSDDICDTSNKKNIIDYLMQVTNDNNEMKMMMMGIIKNNSQIINTNNICANIQNNTINNKNKTFNLQLFLNETCKDAMNISDFIKNIQIPLSDLENFGKNGYVNGITNIIVNNLKALDVTKRPVHCSDIKREIIYVKDNGVWEKETEDNNKMRNVIKYVSHKNIGRIRDWRSIHLDYNENASKNSDIYQQIIGGSNDINRVSTDDSENKIIKKIIKEISIDKTNLITTTTL